MLIGNQSGGANSLEQVVYKKIFVVFWRCLSIKNCLLNCIKILYDILKIYDLCFKEDDIMNRKL